MSWAVSNGLDHVDLRLLVAEGAGVEEIARAFGLSRLRAGAVTRGARAVRAATPVLDILPAPIPESPHVYRGGPVKAGGRKRDRR